MNLSGKLKTGAFCHTEVQQSGRKPGRPVPSGLHRSYKALDNFDTSHNVKFSTYAVPMIIGEIRRYLRDNNAIRSAVL